MRYLCIFLASYTLLLYLLLVTTSYAQKNQTSDVGIKNQYEQTPVSPSNTRYYLEQSTVIPYGAPETGGGGNSLQKMHGKESLPMLLLVLSLLFGLGFKSALYDWMKIKKDLVYKD